MLVNLQAVSLLDMLTDTVPAQRLKLLKPVQMCRLILRSHMLVTLQCEQLLHISLAARLCFICTLCMSASHG